MTNGPFKFPSWMGRFPRQSAPWCEEEIERAVARWREGATVSEIAEEHGRKEQGVIYKLTGILGDEFMKKISPTVGSVDKISAELTAAGYRRISNTHLYIARIDRPDWVDLICEKWGVDRKKFMDHLPTSAFDHYRRTMSKDVKIVSREVYAKLLSSSGDRCGYIEINHVNGES